ncbi:hypothetical protein H0X09_01665 [Candidatus Saccharibacteria bacterium]|nr:hypothetical protein [Candidatus Saccharibacteria bacterium]
MSGVNVSYSLVAHRYGISESTAQSYGTRHGWKAARQAIFEQKVAILTEERANEIAELEKEHINWRNRYNKTQALNYRGPGLKAL